MQCPPVPWMLVKATLVPLPAPSSIMDVLAIARWQFAIVTVYHFFFVPVTLGMSVSIAIMETIYAKTGDEN